MMLTRRALPGLLLMACVASLAGCGGSHGSAAPQATTRASSTAASTTAASTPTTTSAAPSPSTSKPAASSTAAAPSSSAITIPAHLCSATDAAQNAADAYMGALGAGNATEALACVQPGTVPEALTRSLLAKSSGTAVYLPRDGVDGPTLFGYRGNGKSIDVTVSKQPDGQFRVTKVAVRRG